MLVRISGNFLVFPRKIITSTGFYRCCAAGASAPVVVKIGLPVEPKQDLRGPSTVRRSPRKIPKKDPWPRTKFWNPEKTPRKCRKNTPNGHIWYLGGIFLVFSGHFWGYFLRGGVAFFVEFPSPANVSCPSFPRSFRKDQRKTSKNTKDIAHGDTLRAPKSPGK